MNTNNNANKIQAWRDNNPNKQMTKQDLIEILGIDSLQSADLRDANLTAVNLRDADLPASLFYSAGRTHLGSPQMNTKEDTK